MLFLEPRIASSRFWAALTPVLAVALTMATGGMMFVLLGIDPIAAIRIIFWAPLFDAELASYARPQILVKAAPLIIIAIGLSIGFRANIWNIGAEGQYVMGAIAAGATGLVFYPLDAWFIFPLMIVAGIVGGIAWSLIPALLKVKFAVNEILVSLMLVYVAEHFLASVSVGILRNPEGLGFPGSRNFQQYDSAANTELLAGSGIHFGVIVALIAIFAAYGLIRLHRFGYQVNLTGSSVRAARFSGVNTAYLTVICLCTSGALAGLAGVFELTGPAGQLTIDFNVGYGFTAIIVAFLGRLNPFGIAAAGLLIALTYIGGELAQFMLSLPAAAIQSLQGMLLFFLLAFEFLTNYRLRRRIRREAA